MTEIKIRVIRSISVQVVRPNEVVARLLCEYYFLGFSQFKTSLSRKKIMSSQFGHTWEKVHEHSHVSATVKPVDFTRELFCANSAEGQLPATGPAGQTQRCQSSHTCRVYSRACTHLSSWYISPLCHCQIFLSVRYRRPRKRPHHFTCQPVSKHSKQKEISRTVLNELVNWVQPAASGVITGGGRCRAIRRHAVAHSRRRSSQPCS